MFLHEMSASRNLISSTFKNESSDLRRTWRVTSVRDAIL